MQRRHDPTAPVRLAVIVGSTREGRFAPVVAGWFGRRLAERADVEVDVVDLVDVDLPPTLGAASPGLGDYLARLDAAEAFAVVTPEYNHSYPAALKQAIDVAYDEWQHKPVGFVSYGGMSGGLRAVEHLRLVFAELRAVTVRDVVSLHNPWGAFDEHGEPREEGADRAATAMVDELVWWARATRSARSALAGGDGSPQEAA